MLEEENRSRKNNNKTITIVGILIIIVGIIIGAALALRGQTINDAFFESNDNKYVLTEDYEDGGIFGEIKTHTVANVKDDTITGMSIYYEFESADKAKEKFDEINSAYREDDEEIVKNVSINGKYIIIEYTESEYDDMSASDFKAWIDFYEEYKNGGYEYTDEEIDDNTDEPNSDVEEDITEE